VGDKDLFIRNSSWYWWLST